MLCERFPSTITKSSAIRGRRDHVLYDIWQKQGFIQTTEGNIIHGGNPVLKWMAGNVVMRQDPAGNIKPDKEKSVEKIDGIVASIMALDRCIRNGTGSGSVYDERGVIAF